MTHTWILDVLSDLKTFAGENDLTALEQILDDASIIAYAEMASLQSGREKRIAGIKTNDQTIGKLSGDIGPGKQFARLAVVQ